MLAWHLLARSITHPDVQDAGVATYLSGHDHDLQHNVKLSYPDDDNSDPVWPHYVVSGAGSETRKNEKKYYKAKVKTP